MRKNGVSRELVAIDGGVCAVDGFQVGGVCASRETSDLALLYSEKKCVAACVFSEGGLRAPSVTATRKHLQTEFMHAVLINSNIANFCVENGEKTVYSLCWALAQKMKIDREQVAAISVGKLAENYPEKRFAENMLNLIGSLGRGEEERQKFASAIGGVERAYIFKLGDISCKMGAVFGYAEGARVCILTTDIRITSEMLQKALTAVARDTFFMTDEECSPMDTVCIYSNRTATNYPVSEADGDYEKFCYALGAVATDICLQSAKMRGKVLFCKVVGAKSKRAARAVARSVLCERATSPDRILNAIHKTGETIDLRRAFFALENEQGRVVLFEDGHAIAYSKEKAKEILRSDGAKISLDLAEGNYGATAIGSETVGE